MEWSVIVCLLYFAAMLPHNVLGQSYSDADDLVTNLLTGYNTKVRPLNDQSQSVNVNFSINIFQLTNVDPIKGIISISAMYFHSWYDERIIWNPADYGNISNVLIPVKYVWNPKVVCGSPVTNLDVVGDLWMNVRYFSNGYATYIPSDIVESSCAFDVSYWPFDRQTCNITFLAYGYLGTEVTFNIGSEDVISENYVEHGEWKLLGASAVKEKESFSGMEYVNFRINLVRRSAFYVMNIILPVMGIIVLNPMVFLLPSESGERIGYSITVVLSIAVFFTIISDHIPTSSAPMAEIIVLNLVGLVSSMLISLSVILNQRLYFCTEDKVPNWAIKIVKITRCVKKNNAEDGKKDDVHPISSKPNNILDIPDARIAKQTVSEVEWKTVSRAVDKILCCLFLMITLSVSVPFIVLATRD